MPSRPTTALIAPDVQPLLTSFPPVVDRHTRTLILGSLPGTASLAVSQYYGHPRNAFWKLLSAVTGEDLVAMTYEDRLQAVLKHQIGLWDVIANARRIGSLDSNIRDHTHNDLLDLVETLPALKVIAFNGGTAAKIGMKALGEHAQRYRILLLPSSSPAHASLSFEQKLEAWRQLET